jgi:NADH:ubiquinone oxidoreductase subunit 5 (subunit L)/multisubunit Na+/H+ antiporter MnhA subunit
VRSIFAPELLLATTLLIAAKSVLAIPRVDMTSSDKAASDAASFVVTRSGDINLAAALSVLYAITGEAGYNADYSFTPSGLQACPNVY